MSNLFGLTEAQMARLRLFFPKSHGRLRADDLPMLSGIISINGNGLRWCDAPRGYEPAKTHYNHWKRGAITGSLPGSWSAWSPRARIRRRS